MDLCDHHATQTKSSWNVCFSECDNGSGHFLNIQLSKEIPQDTYPYEHFFFFFIFMSRNNPVKYGRVIMRHSVCKSKASWDVLQSVPYPRPLPKRNSVIQWGRYSAS